MATYKEIQAFIKNKYSFTAQTCWIAEMKELSGLDVKQAPNRQNNERQKMCPTDKKDAILDALKHFKMIQA